MYKPLEPHLKFINSHCRESNCAIAVLSNVACSSGIDCKEMPELIRTVDEAIVLWEAEIDAEKERKAAGKPITALNADHINRICAPVIASIRCNDIPSPSTSDSSNTGSCVLVSALHIYNNPRFLT